MQSKKTTLWPDKLDVDHPACHWHTLKKPVSLNAWGGISAHGIEWYIHVLEEHMVPSKLNLFQGRPCQTTYCIYYKSMAFVAFVRVQVVNWASCISGHLPVENIWSIMRQKP